MRRIKGIEGRYADVRYRIFINHWFFPVVPYMLGFCWGLDAQRND